MFELFTCFLLLSVAGFFLLADFLHIPYVASSKAVRNLSKNQTADTSLLDVWLGGVSEWLEKRLKLNEFKREALVIDLRTAQMDMTPERFRANAIVKAGVIGILAIPALFLHGFLSAVLLGIAIYTYVAEGKKLTRKIRKKREAIEYELPKLVATIEKTLLHSRDVLLMLQSYSKNAGPALKDELDITIADMQSGNYGIALTRLENRVGSPQLSDVCRGLISILRGDDTQAYWVNLGLKFNDYQRQKLKRQAQKVPGKVRRLSVALLVCFIAMYFVVILVQVVESLGILFG